MNYQDRDAFGIYRAHIDEDLGPVMMGANTLTGSDVYNKKAEYLGNIKELMINMNNGGVSYSVLTYGGFLGIGEKLFAVPFKALVSDPINKRFTLDIEKDNIQHAPGFDADHWPDMIDESWINSIYHFYGVTRT
jgi:sporulation protein YlmC with PRC-barrel domain